MVRAYKSSVADRKKKLPRLARLIRGRAEQDDASYPGTNR